LLALSALQEHGTVTVSGIVQNPHRGAPLAGVHASVLLFDSGGRLLSRGEAPLDFATLSGGDESPFIVRVPVQGNVARYRVSFRGSDDRVLGHVDRRQAGTAARRQEP
jgi:hypothetical protein